MAIFLIVLTFWVTPFIKNPLALKEYLQLLPKPTIILLLLLALTITLQLVHGLVINQRSLALLDFNAWPFFALIVIFITHIKRYSPQLLIDSMFGATLFLAFKSVVLLWLFSHGLLGVGGVLYGWIRDTGVGEITHVVGPVFRIFFQSQLYCIFGSIIALSLILLDTTRTYMERVGLWIYFYFATLAVVVSQSRSFWIGTAAGIAGIAIFAFYRQKTKSVYLLPSLIVAGLLVASHLFTINVISGNFSGNVLAGRFNNLPSEPASSTRLNELKPLHEAISKQPIFGYGFGKTLTYTSDDPRIRSKQADGQFTTYAFEWGYYDLWLKFGAIGLTIYLAFIAHTAFLIGKETFIKNNALAAGMLAGLLALLATHNFSPYLNHPLGIGFLVLLTSWLLTSKKEKDPQW